MYNRTAPSDCNLARYISGKCGGTTRVAVLVGGNDQLASNILVYVSLRIANNKRIHKALV